MWAYKLCEWHPIRVDVKKKGGGGGIVVCYNSSSMCGYRTDPFSLKTERRVKSRIFAEF